ncbi:MAG: bifunctional phosphoribosyl-AMP cyclohydrolase/phosphoribosyl-ATP diphosphatase HisIE [Bacteroidota bacterium]
MNIDNLDFNKLEGLIPVVVQDQETGMILMVGFMNREALETTLRNRTVTFWSRTKQRLWKKGETSGSVLDVISVTPDCDGDSLLIKAIPAGPVCHTGTTSCFGESGQQGNPDVLRTLRRVIRERRETMPGDSYTAELFRSGTAQIAKKVGEEAVEVALSALEGDRTNLRKETADLLYHLMVLLEQKDVSLEEIAGELKRRAVRGT